MGSVTVLGFVSGAISCVGNTGAVKVGGDLTGFIQGDNMPSVTIGGSVIGGASAAAGRIDGRSHLGNVVIGGDVRGGSAIRAGEISSNGDIASISVGGSVIGGSNSATGFFYAYDSIGAVKVGHDLVGGAGGNGGSIYSQNGGIASVTIGGSLIGGTATGTAPNNGAFDTGSILAHTVIGPVKIGHDVRGGSSIAGGTAGHSGSIGAGTLTSVTVGGSLIGGTGTNAGQIFATGSMGTVTIGHDLIGGSPTGTSVTFNHAGEIRSSGRIASVVIGGSIVAGKGFGTGSDNFNGAIQAGKDIGSLNVKGSLLGNGNGSDTSFVFITALGQAVPGALDVAIGNFTVGGRVEFARVYAGYDLGNTATNGDASIGIVKVGGDWVASDLVAGAQNTPSSNVKFGDGLDTSIGAGNAGRLATISSITIAGAIFGTPLAFVSGDQYGFVAQKIVSLKVAGGVIALAPGQDSISLGGDVSLFEVP
jgi:hypothetical protein